MSEALEEPRLPSYDDSGESAVSQILPPATLYIGGRFIYSSDPDAPPLYESSHSIGFLRDTDRTIKFDRLEHSIRHTTQGTPKVSTRQRHIFDLKHPTPGEWPNFSYQGESSSRQTLCSFGMSTFRPHKLSTAKGYRVHRAARGADRRLAPQELMFTAAPAKERGVMFEWKDAQGRMLAREVETGDVMSLVVTAEMGGGIRDVLVAAWVMRIWWELARGNYRGKRWQEAKRILQTPTPELGGLKGGGLGVAGINIAGR